MDTTGTICAEMERHRAEMGRLVADLKARILAGPDNPRMRRLAPRCGLVTFLDLHVPQGSGKVRKSNWSAEHHDFKRQYEYVVKAIDAAQPDRAADVVREAAEAGVLRVRGDGSSWTLALHPGVVEHLKGVLA